MVTAAPPQASPSARVSPQVPVDGGGPGAPCLLLQEPLLSCVPHCYAQEVSRLCHLSAGTYRIVPSTYLPDTEGAFTVTIATRIDRWGPGQGARSVLVSPSPCPGGAAAGEMPPPGGGRGPGATVSSLLQALHPQPGEAGAAAPGGECGIESGRAQGSPGAASPAPPRATSATGRAVPGDTGTLRAGGLASPALPPQDSRCPASPSFLLQSSFLAVMKT